MAGKEQVKKENVHKGHRKRMKEDFEVMSFDIWHEHEVLEYMLQMALPRVDTNETAHNLIKKCGGFANVFRASKKQLTDVYGVGEKAAEYLHTLGEFVHYYNRRRFDLNREVLDSGTCQKYMLDVFDGKEREHFYVICLDSNNRVIAKMEEVEGGFDSIDIDVPKIVRFAVMNDAPNVVLAHNHPSGILKASNADIVSTQTVARVLLMCGITLVDHIIVAGGQCMSMRSEGLLDKKQMRKSKR